MTDESESRKSVSSSVKLAIIWINKCLEFYILLVNSKKLRTSQKVPVVAWCNSLKKHVK
jgi:hypothetical protein